MINRLLGLLLDKLKVANPTMFLVVTAVLLAAYNGLTYLETSLGLPGWLSSALPYLKGFLAVLGIGLNSATYEFTKR